MSAKQAKRLRKTAKNFIAAVHGDQNPDFHAKNYLENTKQRGEMKVPKGVSRLEDIVKTVGPLRVDSKSPRGIYLSLKKAQGAGAIPTIPQIKG